MDDSEVGKPHILQTLQIYNFYRLCEIQIHPWYLPLPISSKSRKTKFMDTLLPIPGPCVMIIFENVIHIRENPYILQIWKAMSLISSSW